jgi:hypothetical protein
MKKFKFLKPSLFKLEGEFFAIETDKGYKMQITEGWLGFTKPIIENCDHLFQFIEDVVVKKKRPRIKAKKI